MNDTTTALPMPSASVAERLLTEGLLSLVEASKLLPPVRGKRVSTSSLFRWIVRGKGKIKLEGVRLHGSGWWTSKAALARFASAITAQAQAA
jgi:hypothetical protein